VSRVAAALIAVLVLGTGCGAPEPAERAEGAERAESGDAAPVSLRATLVLEPDRLAIGDVVTAEVVVVTPPGYRVLPIAPVKLPALWLLGARALPPQENGARWIHRTRFRVRPRALGEQVWPATSVTIERPDGTTETLEVAERRFEVASDPERFPGREEPFGLQEPSPPADASPGFGIGVATGLGVAALLALVGLALRRAPGPKPEDEGAAARPDPSLASWARERLDEAIASCEQDARVAAGAGSRVLRVYMSRRFGSETEAATTEELERAEPALAERALWPDFVRILHSFDDERFRPHAAQPPGDSSRMRIRNALAESQRLVDASTSRESRR
jgi:hypothetical protein